MARGFDAEEFITGLDASELSELRALLDEDPYATMIETYGASSESFGHEEDWDE